MDWDTVEAELKKKLNPAHVKPPPQGKYGEYIEGWHAISEANRIFGFGGWSYEISSLQLTNATADGGKHRVGYFAHISVTVDGVTRGDVGHGQGFGKSEGDAHDSAVKEAVTDGLKRALRSFGNPFGLALYDKTKTNVGAPERDPSDIRDTLKSVVIKADDWPSLKKLVNGPKFSDALNWLVENDPPKALEVKSHADTHALTLDPSGQAPELFERKAS